MQLPMSILLQLLGLPKDYNQTAIMRAMVESWYCLQPTGDSPTRAHVFDCLAAGANHDHIVQPMCQTFPPCILKYVLTIAMVAQAQYLSFSTSIF